MKTYSVRFYNEEGKFVTKWVNATSKKDAAKQVSGQVVSVDRM